MNKIQQFYQALLNAYGIQGWWPLNGKYSGKSRLTESDQFEICVGAILTQNTAWRNVEKALQNLRTAGVLDCKKVADAKPEQLAQLIRPAGYFNQKTKKLQLFATHVQSHGMKKMLGQSVPQLREELLALWGIGPETADSIILYAAQKPVFVIDAYTRRIFARLGNCKEDCAYDSLQRLFMTSLPSDVQLFKEYHALIVEHGKYNNFK